MTQVESVQAFVYIFYENTLFYTCKMSNENYKFQLVISTTLI